MSIVATYVRDVRDDVRADVWPQTHMAVGVCGMCGNTLCAGVQARAYEAACIQKILPIRAGENPHIPHIPHIPTATRISGISKPAHNPARAAHGRARAISHISLVSKGMEGEGLWI
ncbi:hypothetical protein NG829_08400 [Xanthomonas sacchari]|uniref:hypothetical protein n=1 Tax=Xanthomonas sacchari TaxID=56458 RepID=UPI00225DDEBD|nr:hypothetical protein [Xanthomonas sacchari]UYK82296.1 hypothetical protein NG829_08400 [Xanthomonas sacchari]